MLCVWRHPSGISEHTPYTHQALCVHAGVTSILCTVETIISFEEAGSETLSGFCKVVKEKLMMLLEDT